MMSFNPRDLNNAVTQEKILTSIKGWNPRLTGWTALGFKPIRGPTYRMKKERGGHSQREQESRNQPEDLKNKKRTGSNAQHYQLKTLWPTSEWRNAPSRPYPALFTIVLNHLWLSLLAVWGLHLQHVLGATLNYSRIYSQRTPFNATENRQLCYLCLMSSGILPVILSGSNCLSYFRVLLEYLITVFRRKTVS